MPDINDLKERMADMEQPYLITHHSQLRPSELPAVDLLKFQDRDPDGFVKYIALCRAVRAGL